MGYNEHARRGVGWGMGGSVVVRARWVVGCLEGGIDVGSNDGMNVGVTEGWGVGMSMGGIVGDNPD